MSRAFRATSVWFVSTLSFFLVGVLAKADGLETTLEVKPNEVILCFPISRIITVSHKVNF